MDVAAYGVLDYAMEYLRGGISILPIATDGQKRPDTPLLPKVYDDEKGQYRPSWKPFQTKLPAEKDVRKWYGGRLPPGIAAICGAVSGCLELIDFDREAETIFPAWHELVEQSVRGATQRVTIHKSPRGWHVWFRCPEMETPGNKDLAVDPEKKGKERVLIQTRGEGGYALVPGSPAACHPDGGTYEHYSGARLWDCADVSLDERDLLIACARYFNRERKCEAAAPATATEGAGLRPGDDFERRGPDWADLLEPHGWTLARTANGERWWRRPGKDRCWSATTGHCKGADGADLLRVFTSSAFPFEEGKCYGKFRAFTLLNHGGDHAAAARELGRRGFGSQVPPAKLQPGRNGAAHSNGQAAAVAPTDEPEDDGSVSATLADVARHLADLSWLWPGWIQRGAMVAVASDAGVGKTRLVTDLIRRIRQGLCWPDGQQMTLAADAPVIYLPCDHQHAEMISACRSFGIPLSSVLLNTTPAEPFGGLDLDSAAVLRALTRRIETCRPAMVIVDTVTHATEANLCRTEEAQRFFGGLRRLALEHQTTFVLIAHLNAAGKTLGRRIDGAARQVIKLEWPDPEGQPHRRKLLMAKSNSKYPAPLGVTMRDAGNDYDDKPPSPPPDAPGAPPGSKLAEANKWLKTRLDKGPVRLAVLRNEAAASGFSAPVLYLSRDVLGVVEFTPEGERGKWWQLPVKNAPEPSGGED